MRNTRIHFLKTDPAVFNETKNGRKDFEIRLNDRDYQVGDVLRLMETEFSGEEMKQGADLVYTGEEYFSEIVYILDGGYGLAEDWVVMQTFAINTN